MSHSATSTAAMAAMVTGPRRQYGAAIEILPDILGVEGIAPDDARNHVIGEIACHREFAAVQGAIAEAVDPLVRLDFERDEVSPRRSDVHVRVRDLHSGPAPSPYVPVLTY